jgi:hypothetical protein
MPNDGAPITPAQFGENLFARVFSPDAILRQIDRAITEREFIIDQPDVPVVEPIPIFTTSTSGVAKIAPLGLRVVGPGQFDALLHVDIKPLSVTFNTGGVEMWDISVDAALHVQVSLHAPLVVQIDLTPPTAESIQVSCLNVNDNWGITRGPVEEQIRAKLTETLTRTIVTSARDRRVDLEAQMRAAMEAPKPVVVNLTPAAEDELPDLKLGVDGAFVYRDDDGTWVLRARAKVTNSTASMITIGRERFGLAGWNESGSREGDFPTRIVLPPGASMEGNLGYYISGDHPAPRVAWFEVAGYTKVPWRREVIVAEVGAPPVRGAPWPPGGRIDCARASAGFKWLDSGKDQVVSTFLALRNQGYAGLYLPPEYFTAVLPTGRGTFYSSASSFGDGLLLPGQSTVTALVSWYWKSDTAVGNELDVRFGPPKSPYGQFKVPLVEGEPMCSR